MKEVVIQVSADPRERATIMASTAQAICEEVGVDPADGVMMLLTAAAKIAFRHADRSPDEVENGLHTALRSACTAARAWFVAKQ